MKKCLFWICNRENWFLFNKEKRNEEEKGEKENNAIKKSKQSNIQQRKNKWKQRRIIFVQAILITWNIFVVLVFCQRLQY
jgi:hypothetical protein